jgi:Domain of unknown function (DUF4386)
VTARAVRVRRSGMTAHDRGAFSGPLIGVSFAAGIGGSIVRASSPYPRPWASPADVRKYFSENPGAARLSATGQLISAASLARFTVSVTRLAARSGDQSRRLQAAAVGGGALASASLATSVVCAAALSGSRGRRKSSAATLHRTSFQAGGPIHGAGFGLLCGALGLAGLRTGELPRPLAITALAAAVPGLLSPLYFVARTAGWLIPAGRFPGLIASGIAGVKLAQRE